MQFITKCHTIHWVTDCYMGLRTAAYLIEIFFGRSRAQWLDVGIDIVFVLMFTSRLHASNAVYHYEETDLGTDSWQEHGLVNLAFILLNFYCVQKLCLCRKLSFDFARWWRYLMSFSCVPNILDAKIQPLCVVSICFYIGILPVTENPHIVNMLTCFWVIASSEICGSMQVSIGQIFLEYSFAWLKIHASLWTDLSPCRKSTSKVSIHFQYLKIGEHSKLHPVW
jgi:hypothetical protein